jgi:hypothetical protein
MLDVADRLAIHEVVGLYGHLLDDREWSRLGEVFTDDAVFDGRPAGGTVTRTLDELRDHFSGDELQHPLAHHATNIVVYEESGVVRVVSKGIAVGYRGRVGSIVYRDVVRRTEAGWRLAERVVLLRLPSSSDATE